MSKSLPAEELDRMFDAGEDINEYVDWESTRPLCTQARRVSVDMPDWMIRELDRHAEKIGVSRQAFIKFALNEKLEHLSLPG